MTMNVPLIRVKLLQAINGNLYSYSYSCLCERSLILVASVNLKKSSVSFHRSVQILTGRRHADTEDILDPSCFLSAYFYQFFLSVLQMFYHFMHICHYDFTCKRICTLLDKKKKNSNLIIVTRLRVEPTIYQSWSDRLTFYHYATKSCSMTDLR